MLSAKNLHHTIDNRIVLNQVSVTIKPKEIVSVIGPSGAGKTTLLRSLALLEFPNSGTLSVDDKDYLFPIQNPEALHYPYPKLTVVFQQLFMWPHLTIRENLLLPLRGNLEPLYFKDVIDLFQMNGFLDRYPDQVSIGQRQRAALVRALLLRPTYLLLDEVTSALDIEQSHLILSHLREIANQGVGILWVSHALHLAKKISDKMVFMERGRDRKSVV